MITARELKEKYLSFFESKNHRRIPGASLIPENDPTALFINSGMHPLVPYLLGEPHPLGRRLTSVQRCVRTGDIDEVGDYCHQTFFEMLGNWSLGDYWKEEAVSLSWEFLTKHLQIPVEKLAMTVFAGDKNAPRDEETAALWQKMGLPAGQVFFLPAEDNWWAVGSTGPCGPDTEMFFVTDHPACGPACRPGCHCGHYLEIWNDVFMAFNRQSDGKLVQLVQRNIDTGMGVERTTAILNGFNNNYETEVFRPLIAKVESLSGRHYAGCDQRSMRVIADHLRAATFLLADGILPANVDQGYVLRRLIRRAVRAGRELGLQSSFGSRIVGEVVALYGQQYPFLVQKEKQICADLEKEEVKFFQAIAAGQKAFAKLAKNKTLSGEQAFFLYETYGLPWEIVADLAAEAKIDLDEAGFKEALKKHQQTSRACLEKRFCGGLADHSAAEIAFHTTTHLLHQALRQTLGDHVHQAGSNITPERLRFDFVHPQKLTPAEVTAVEKIVNTQIDAKLPVKMEIMSLEEAEKKGALAFFKEKYGEKVKVFSIGDFSREVCGGPHVGNTGEINHVKITKQENVGAGRRRLYAVFEN